jgi:hypothetical protein
VLFTGTYIVAGALFACDGLPKLLAGPTPIVRVSGAIELAAGVLGAAWRLPRRLSIS